MRDITAAFVRYAEAVSVEAAEEWRGGLMDIVAGLATFPRRYPIATEQFRREVHQLLYQRPGSLVAYRVLFTITGEQTQSPDSPTVIILHVRHATARPITRTQAREIETEE